MAIGLGQQFQSGVAGGHHPGYVSSKRMAVGSSKRSLTFLEPSGGGISRRRERSQTSTRKGNRCAVGCLGGAYPGEGVGQILVVNLQVCLGRRGFVLIMVEGASLVLVATMAIYKDVATQRVLVLYAVSVSEAAWRVHATQQWKREHPPRPLDLGEPT